MKELEKVEKYQLLKDETEKVCHMRKVISVPVVIGALGAVSVNFKKVHEAHWRESEFGSHPENSIAC